MKSVYKQYKDRLIEITGRNRSLFSRKISKKNSYDIGKLLHNDSKAAEDIIDYIWKGRKRAYKLLDVNSADTKNNVARNIIREESVTRTQVKKAIEAELKDLIRLKREIIEIERETGRYELFIGFPFVEGFLKDVPVRAPLLLFPIKINPDNHECEIEFMPYEPVQINKVFALAYAKAYNLDLDKFDFEIDNLPAGGFTDIAAVVKHLRGAGIRLKYSERKNLLSFESAREPRPGDDLEVRNYMVLGRFPLANSIYNDYGILEKNRLTTPAIDMLISGREAKNKKTGKNTELYAINQLDYAQENAIDLINRVGNLVIYGPPGTGKSQTIVNIISDALCKNKRVLVVSQKRAALEVVFNRLKELNKKCIILPDAEKSKQEFYERVRVTHDEVMGFVSTYATDKYDIAEANLKSEINALEQISSVLFSPTDFGLSLEQMYLNSFSLGKNTANYKIYESMLKTEIMRYKYDELFSTLRVIEEKNKDVLYFKHLNLYKQNPLIDHLHTNIDVHRLNEAKKLINSILIKTPAPLNTAKLPNSRYLLTYLLENDVDDLSNTNLQDLTNAIYRLQNKKLSRSTNLSYIPPLTLSTPFFLAKQNKKKGEIKKTLTSAQEQLVKYVGNFKLLKSVLDQKGFAMTIDGIANGNLVYLRKLLAALNDYDQLRNIKIVLDNLTKTEKVILGFAETLATTERSFRDIVKKILPIRIYHEVVKMEKQHDRELSKIITFEDTRNRIVSLKNEQRLLVREMALEKFNADYINYYNNSPDNKNYIHEVLKQRGLWPIRRMCENFMDFLLQLFPCWLLSPEAVSTILPLQRELFDLVVFDEASQIFIENSIPTIYRGKCVAVSGDNKQLRPTSAFVKRYMGVEQNEEQDLATAAALEVESLLDLATSRYPSAHLTYHYRSKNEELINFSNYAFYSGNLQVAPNITRNIGKRPIERIKVNGSWEDRHNHEEAVNLVALIKKLLRTRKNNETLGVITFNTEQEEYIKDMLDAESAKDAWFKKQYLAEQNRKEDGEDVSIFVKNIENVQGDERDIIIFSIAYARNNNEHIVSQFGSLSQAGGENRLNVAITRAKSKIYVVTSIEPEELTNIENSKHMGPKILKKYLQYVRAVSKGEHKEARMLLSSMTYEKKPKAVVAGSDIAPQLKKKLEALGYTVHANLGNADYKLALGIYSKEFDRYLLGIETDVDVFLSSDSVLERDVYRPKFLESRGWNIMRVWSRDWWTNSAKVISAVEIAANAKRRRLLESGAKINKKASSSAAKSTSAAETNKTKFVLPERVKLTVNKKTVPAKSKAVASN